MNLEYCRVVASRHDKDSFLAIMPEVYGPGSSLGAIEVSHQYGFASRPVDMDSEGGACGAYYGTQGAQGFAWLANDGRIQAKLPEIKAGESFQYGATGNFVRCHQDGRISLFTTDNATVDGRTIALTIGPDGLVFNAPWGNLKFDATGFHVLHSSGARIDLGAGSSTLLPPPLDKLSSYATISAAMSSVESSVVSTGSSKGVATPVARSDALLVALQAIAGALQAMQVPGAFTTTQGPVAPGEAEPAIAAAIAAIATSATTIPSSSTMAT